MVDLDYNSSMGWLAISVTKNCAKLERKRKCRSHCLEDTDRLFIDSCHNELLWEYEKLLFTEIVGSRSRFGWPGMSTFDLREKVSLRPLNSIRRGHQNVLRASKDFFISIKIVRKGLSELITSLPIKMERHLKSVVFTQ